MNGPPAVDAAFLQGVQGLLPEGVVGAAAFPDELFGLLAHGHAVGGAAALDDGQALLPHGTLHLVFGGQQHGADEGQVPLGQVGDRRKAADAALPPEIHVKGLHSIVQMVPQRHLVAAQLLRGGVQGTPAQLGAEGTGIGFFPDIKENFSDFRRYDLIRNLNFLAQRFDWFQIHGIDSHIHSDCGQ